MVPFDVHFLYTLITIWAPSLHSIRKFPCSDIKWHIVKQYFDWHCELSKLFLKIKMAAKSHLAIHDTLILMPDMSLAHTNYLKCKCYIKFCDHYWWPSSLTLKSKMAGSQGHSRSRAICKWYIWNLHIQFVQNRPFADSDCLIQVSLLYRTFLILCISQLCIYSDNWGTSTYLPLVVLILWLS